LWHCRHDSQTPFASVAVLARWARELPAEIDRRLGSLKEVGEKQVILDIWVLRELLSRLPRMAAERPNRLTKEQVMRLLSCGAKP
jgi:hypothetical protein